MTPKYATDFKAVCNAQHLTASAPLVKVGEERYHCNINFSSIITKLIQEAGRWCKFYASDLFVDLFAIQKMLDGEKDLVPGAYLFGFRESGVDGNYFILSRYDSDRTYVRHEYRALWRLDIAVSDDNDLFMDLYEVTR